ncbi:uracil phosphoribosyltransferase [Carnobacterium sp. AT7]|nr:uracil phosphoribosyltransferase [Carnobacterium sp. AT7]
MKNKIVFHFLLYFKSNGGMIANASEKREFILGISQYFLHSKMNRSTFYLIHLNRKES